MSNITFSRVTSKDDYPILMKLARQIWAITYQDILSPAQFDYMIQMMYAPDVIEKEIGEGIVFEMVKDGTVPVGFISYGPYAQGVIKLHKLYLSKEYHGMGVGSQMLSRVKEIARTLGAKKLLLNVNKQNARAIRAYERNGFKRVREEKNPIGNGYFMDDYVYGVDLV
jgi:diamine N-acetyltransferase